MEEDCLKLGLLTTAEILPLVVGPCRYKRCLGLDVGVWEPLPALYKYVVCAIP